MPSSRHKGDASVTQLNRRQYHSVISGTKAVVLTCFESGMRCAHEMLRAVAVIVGVLAATGCAPSAARPKPLDVAAAAESYVRLVLALGERDADSLDGYHGPPAWAAEARARHVTLDEVRRQAQALSGTLASTRFRNDDEDVRRTFLLGQLGAIAARIEILGGARPSFADEARRLFGLETDPRIDADEGAATEIRAAIDRELPGHGTTAERFGAFDRRFLIPADRLPAVMARAIEACRSATRVHVKLPPSERVDLSYVRDLPWSALTSYDGDFHSTIRINAAMPLTVDRALDLACHEAYPGHHTFGILLETRLAGRVELLAQPTFSPQSLLHEGAASVAGTLAFTDEQRVELERDALFPLAGLDRAEAARHVRVSRLVDRLHGVEAAIAQRYLDGELDFPRASAAFARDALMPSADATLKFLNQFRSYAATYTIGRDRFWRALTEMSAMSAVTKEDDRDGRWRAYADLAANPTQALPSR
jgi:hypothetical protein